MILPITVVWDFNPVFFSIGSLDVRYYGLMWALALLIGAWQGDEAQLAAVRDLPEALRAQVVEHSAEAVRAWREATRTVQH